MRCAYLYAFVRYHVYNMSLYFSIKNFTIEVNLIEVVLVDTIYIDPSTCSKNSAFFGTQIDLFEGKKFFCSIW